VTYALPKKMGSAHGWTDQDHVRLCEVYVKVMTNAVKGTARTRDNLWATVHEVWSGKMRNKVPLRVGSLEIALEKPFNHIWARMSACTPHCLAIKAMTTTGNESEEDIFSRAVERYCSLDEYDAILAHRNQNTVIDKTRKLNAKVPHCKWVA